MLKTQEVTCKVLEDLNIDLNINSQERDIDALVQEENQGTGEHAVSIG